MTQDQATQDGADLTGPQRRMYELLDLNPGIIIDVRAAAALAGSSDTEAASVLDRLRSWSRAEDVRRS